MRVIIAGSRNFNDYKFLKRRCDYLLKDIMNIEIVSGTAKGADKLGELYARRKKFNLKKFPAKWRKYGKAAEFIRNKEMAKYSHMLIAFWDGQSKRTKHMIECAKEYNLKVIQINYSNTYETR